MDVYTAIHQMREMSERGIAFSFSYMTYSEDDNKSHGVVEVLHGRLRKQSQVKNNRNTDIMLNYIDLDTNEYRRFYQPLLMEFEGQKLELL